MSAGPQPGSGYRRTKLVALGALGALAVTFGATSGTTAAAPRTPAAEEFNFGRGQAIAQTIKVDPRAAELSLGIGGGISLAGHQNHTGSAESRGVDLGIVGQLLAAEGCDPDGDGPEPPGDPTLPADKQPHANSVRTGDPKAGGWEEQDDKVPVITKYVEAGDGSATAITKISNVGIPGVLEIGSTISRATSHVVDGVREAIATVDISYLRFGGTIEIDGLHWEAVQHSGGDSTITGAFSIGGGFLTTGLLGIKVPLPLDSGKAIEAISNLTEALKLGLEIREPRVHQEGDVMFVDPMVIGVFPSAARDELVRPVMEGVQPIYHDLNVAIQEKECSYKSLATVEDVAIGSLTGAGSFGVQVGGVQATTASISQFVFKGLAPGVGVGGGTNVGVGGGSTSSGSVASSPRAAVPAPAPGPTQSATQPAAPAPSPATSPVKAVGKRGGALAGVGLAGLALLALVAEGDRRKMRNAQRMIPMEG